MDNNDSIKKELTLKNPIAQKLLEQKSIVINGIKLNFWQGQTYNIIKAQEGWNKVKYRSELNKLSTGLSGNIVMTGIMQIPRYEAELYAVQMGFFVHKHIAHNTDYIIVGSENISPSKIAKAIEFNNSGSNIRLIDELSFLETVAENI